MTENIQAIEQEYWAEKVKACPDIRLDGLVPGDMPRQEKERIIVEQFTKEFAKIYAAAMEAKQAGEAEKASALVWILRNVGSELDRRTWEEEQATKKECYEKYGWGNKVDCNNCGKVIYASDGRVCYCNDRCRESAYRKRKSRKLQAIRNNRVCLFCKTQFSAKRVDAKYCCESHRVRACLARLR